MKVTRRWWDSGVVGWFASAAAYNLIEARWLVGALWAALLAIFLLVEYRTADRAATARLREALAHPPAVRLEKDERNDRT